jgi:hypothetical protein
MSTAPTTAAALVPAEAPPPKEVVLISHSTLFYWWPVWAVGYVMALITFLHDDRMVTVPPATKLYHKADAEVKYANETIKDRKPVFTPADAPVQLKQQDVLVAPEGATVGSPRLLHMTSSNNLGVIYAIVLLLVIFITNVPMRGLWSLIVIILIILISVIFALLDVWETILTAMSWLDIRINLGGYLFISTVLLILWLVIFFVFDRQIYMIFTPGNVRLQLAIGDGETTYDTTGMTVQKERSDLFRHYILGLGSGDLIVRTAGAQAHQFEMPNVLSISGKVRAVEELLRTRQVVAAQMPPSR